MTRTLIAAVFTAVFLGASGLAAGQSPQVSGRADTLDPLTGTALRDKALDLLTGGLTAPIRKTIREGERAAKGKDAAENELSDQLDGVIKGEFRGNDERLDRAMTDYQEGTLEAIDGARAFGRKATERALTLPLTYGLKRLKQVGPEAEEFANTAEAVLRGGKALNKALQPRVPVYEFRAGRGRLEVWDVGHQGADGLYQSDTPKLLQSLPPPFRPAPAASPRPSPSPSFSTNARPGTNPRDRVPQQPSEPRPTCTGPGACAVR